MPFRFLRLQGFLAAAILLLATLVALPAAAQDRADIVAEICSGDFAAQQSALSRLAGAGVEAGSEGALWARRIVEAFEGRSLRCGDGLAVIDTPDGPLRASTLEPAEGVDTSTLSAPSVNLRLRAVAASAGAVLRLFTEESVAARAEAAAYVDRRREALTPEILAAAVERETDAALRDTLSTLRASLLLADPDPVNRIAAIEAIAQDATLRNRTAIAEALAGETDAAVLAAGEKAMAGIDRTLALGKVLATLYSGASYASVLFLAALGLAIIFGLMGVINLAQGELIMIGAYAAWFTQEAIRAALPGLLDYYLILAIPVSFLAAALVGLLMEVLVIRRLYDRPLMTLLATWAISLLLINTVRVTVGSQNLEFYQPAYVSGGFPVLGDFIMTSNRLFAIAVALFAFIAVVILLRRSLFGMNVRAVTQNRAMAGAAGIDTRRTDMMAFALGSGLAGLAGLALSPLYNVNPGMGTGFIVDSFMVVVLGGVGSLVGAIVAALGIGQINVVIEPIYGAVAAKVLVLLLVIVFIQWRPEGLFAPKGRR
ncbi:urea ABC transporter permease subunit UrtB [Thetidibacter halocola]|uniref:Urea ABC transporter permease subunit UrtB n=1 Tax=Thetidibacter halocola TaxID=2827239 RepID=A0A8J8B6X7_9RHOB|nr:urea ABC transporter permease subunit UrtB [Thetidibacter halocola]MBS0123109.1 urea ABC transporter permease subunit UrtB [Thetidibacter halocola]